MRVEYSKRAVMGGPLGFGPKTSGRLTAEIYETCARQIRQLPTKGLSPSGGPETDRRFRNDASTSEAWRKSD